MNKINEGRMAGKNQRTIESLSKDFEKKEWANKRTHSFFYFSNILF